MTRRRFDATVLSSMFRYWYRQPYWLKPGERVEWDHHRPSLFDDCVVFRICLVRKEPEDYRFAEGRIQESDLRRAARQGHAAMVDLAAAKFDEMMKELAPPLDDDLLELSTQALNGHDALSVLVDALVGRGLIAATPQPWFWHHTDRSTGAAASLYEQALLYARNAVGPHIFQHWQTRPWVEHVSAYESLRFRQIQDVLSVGAISQEQARALLEQEPR